MQVASLTRNEMVDIIKKDSNESINQDILLLCDILKNDNLSSEEIVDVSMKISSRNIRKNIISKIDFNQKHFNGSYILGEDEIQLLYNERKNYGNWEMKIPLYFEIDCNTILKNFNILEYMYDLTSENKKI